MLAPQTVLSEVMNMLISLIVFLKHNITLHSINACHYKLSICYKVKEKNIKEKDNVVFLIESINEMSSFADSKY